MDTPVSLDFFRGTPTGELLLSQAPWMIETSARWGRKEETPGGDATCSSLNMNPADPNQVLEFLGEPSLGRTSSVAPSTGSAEVATNGRSNGPSGGARPRFEYKKIGECLFEPTMDRGECRCLWSMLQKKPVPRYTQFSVRWARESLSVVSFW